VAVQSPETTQGRDARSTVAEMESQETAGSTGVNSYVACLMLAHFGLRAMSDLSPECAPKRTSANASEFVGSRLIGPFAKLSRSGFD
jgi:hypothetical protein